MASDELLSDLIDMEERDSSRLPVSPGLSLGESEFDIQHNYRSGAACGLPLVESNDNPITPNMVHTIPPPLYVFF